MYDFPCIETETATDADHILELCKKQEILAGLPFTVKSVSDEYIHILSHRRLLAVFIHIIVKTEPALGDDITAVAIDEIAALPIPRLIDRYLASLL